MNVGPIGTQFGGSAGDFLFALFFGVTALGAAALGYVMLARATYRVFTDTVLNDGRAGFADKDDIKRSLVALGYALIVAWFMFS